MEYQIVFIYGLVFGSYFNQVAYREGMSGSERIKASRSSCDFCGYRLGAWDLIPVLSYVMLGGRCRNCQTRLSILYPLSEVLTANLFVFSYSRYGWSRDFFFEITLWSMLVVFTLMDLYYLRISNRLLVVFGVLLIILTPLTGKQMLLGAMVQVFIFTLASYFSQSGIGMGDIKLMVVLGLVLGYWQSLVILSLASFLGLLFLIGRPRNKLAFVPFILIASLITQILPGL